MDSFKDLEQEINALRKGLQDIEKVSHIFPGYFEPKPYHSKYIYHIESISPWPYYLIGVRTHQKLNQSRPRLNEFSNSDTCLMLTKCLHIHLTQISSLNKWLKKEKKIDLRENCIFILYICVCAPLCKRRLASLRPKSKTLETDLWQWCRIFALWPATALLR